MKVQPARQLKYTEETPEDSKELKKKNFGIDFSLCRGHVSEKEKKAGKVLNEKTNETLRQRICMVLRDIVVDWKTADDDYENFAKQWPMNKIKQHLLDTVRCVDYDKTKFEEEVNILQGDTTE